MAASGQFDRGIDPETPGAGERGRTSDLLITNYPQAPPEQTQEDLSAQKPEDLD